MSETFQGLNPTILLGMVWLFRPLVPFIFWVRGAAKNSQWFATHAENCELPLAENKAKPGFRRSGPAGWVQLFLGVGTFSCGWV